MRLMIAMNPLTTHVWDFLFPPSDTELRVRALKPIDFEGISPSEAPEKWIESILPYEHPYTHDLIYALKFERSHAAAQLGATLLSDALMEFLSDKRQFGEVSGPTLCPIPISHKRLKKRQYNQCELLLKHLPSRHMFSVEKLLSRRVSNKPQSHTTSRKERLENIKGTFRVNNKSDVRGKDIILIDDVTTTGATLREARRMLLDAGAKNVYAFTLAH